MAKGNIKELTASMLLIREVEKSVLELFSKGLINGTTHTCIGMEATAVGVVHNLDENKDFVISNHRNHGHFLAFNGELDSFYAELLGRQGALCGGYGGSQHLHKGRFFSFGILGGTAPIANGIALSLKLQCEEDGIVCVFIGDGALGEGAIYEAFNIAALWKLPVLFVIEDNGIAQTTPRNASVAGSIASRPRAFGIPTTFRKSADVVELFDLSQQIIGKMRAHRGPVALVVENARLGPHSKGDDTRDPVQLEELKRFDPLEIAREKFTAEEFQLMTERAVEEVRCVVADVMGRNEIDLEQS
jgi:TPP-dependent pyruvate/acetoin dehydrogenase alpha subunit